MKIIITRHGETEENKAGIIQGHLPGVLSELGKEQAEKLAERLRDEGLDLIISSDLARAHDTAKTIGELHSDIDLTLDERLRERFLGELQGETKKGVGLPKGIHLMDFIKEGSFESDEKIFVRARALIKDILGKSEKDVLLVGHEGICGYIIGILLNKNDEELKKVIGLENTSVTIFEGDENNMKLKLLNDTSHLG